MRLPIPILNPSLVNAAGSKTIHVDGLRIEIRLDSEIREMPSNS